MPKVTLITKSCKGMDDCGICALVCPKDLFSPSDQLNEAGYLPPVPPDEGECTTCGNCEIFCPDFALIVESDEKGEANNG